MTYRPTQLEVDAMAERLFGSGWKQAWDGLKAYADYWIAARLDAARAAVIREHAR